MKIFEAQSSLQFKVSTGLNVNKESDTGVIDINGKLRSYKITWQHVQLFKRKQTMVQNHTNRDIDSLADLLTHKPLPEIEEKVESSVRHSHLSQISLISALKDWINHEFHNIYAVVHSHRYPMNMTIGTFQLQM